MPAAVEEVVVSDELASLAVILACDGLSESEMVARLRRASEQGIQTNHVILSRPGGDYSPQLRIQMGRLEECGYGYKNAAFRLSEIGREVCELALLGKYVRDKPGTMACALAVGCDVQSLLDKYVELYLIGREIIERTG